MHNLDRLSSVLLTVDVDLIPCLFYFLCLFVTQGVLRLHAGGRADIKQARFRAWLLTYARAHADSNPINDKLFLPSGRHISYASVPFVHTKRIVLNDCLL